MRKSCFLLLALSCLLLLAGCQSTASAGPVTSTITASASASTPTRTPTSPAVTVTPTVGPQASCPQLPAAQPGPAPAAPLSLYVVPSDGVLTALNASDGSIRWKEDNAVAGISLAAVAVEQNVVYQLTVDGRLLALNASDGTLRWCDAEGQALLSSIGHGQLYLAVDQDAVYLGGSNNDLNALVALNVSDGKQLWQEQAADDLLTLVAADGQVYVSSEEVSSAGAVSDTLTALNATTGKAVWHFQTGNGIFTQPAVANGVAYVAEGNPNFPSFLYALNASNGSQRWHVQGQASGEFGAPRVLNGVVYVAGSQGVYAFDASTGAQRWKVSPQALTTMGPVVDAGGCYFASVNGNTGQTTIYALNLSNGSQRWQSQPTIAALASGVPLAPASSSTGLTVFAAANGLVYVTTYTSIGALNASDGKQAWSAAGAALAVG